MKRHGEGIRGLPAKYLLKRKGGNCSNLKKPKAPLRHDYQDANRQLNF